MDLTQKPTVLLKIKKHSQSLNKQTPSASRHVRAREPPLPVYIGLKTHTQTRSKKMVNSLNELGISISYSRVLEIESQLSMAVCKRYTEDNLLCPPGLRHQLYTVGALDNIDHNPSPTTGEFFPWHRHQFVPVPNSRKCWTAKKRHQHPGLI